MKNKCKKCGHDKALHVIDSFGNPVCDKVTNHSDGNYDFECDCKEFKEVKIWLRKKQYLQLV